MCVEFWEGILRMADLLLEPTEDGGKISFDSKGDFRVTDSIFNSAYIASFANPYWGNQISDENSRLKSRLSDLFKENVSNDTRNKAVRFLQEALSYLIRSGVSQDVQINGTIQSPSYIKLTALIIEPDGTSREFSYGLNWKSQSLEYPLGGIE